VTAVAAFAGSKVDNVALSYQKGYTVAAIDVDGPVVRFSHQTEEAKDGKPFRIIVDIITATHHLGQKTFHDLPACPITAIRTSQYAVEPEQVVRVVFDMKAETVYRIDSDDKSVNVYIPDEQGKTFAAWSTSEWLAEQARQQKAEMAELPTTEAEPTVTKPVPNKSVKARNQAFDNDRLASLTDSRTASQNEQPVKKTETKVETPVAKPAPQPAVKTSEKEQTTLSQAAAAPSQQTTPRKPNTTEAVETKAPTPTKDKAVESRKPAEPLPKPQGEYAVEHLSVPVGTERMASYPGEWVETPKPVVKKQASPQVVAQPQPKPTTQVAKADPEPAKKPAVVNEKPAGKQLAQTTAKPGVSDEPSGPPAPKAAAKQSSVKPDNAKKQSGSKPALAKANKNDKKAEEAPVIVAQEDNKSNSTSRFRRQPAMSKKMRGTLVAEFPKRLVIKYSAAGYRDPFETLINESRVLSSPTEQRVPNVEGLKLVGVIQSPSGSRALFEDTDGYGYFLKAGDKVQKGYVLRIETDRVYFQIFEYGWSRTVALAIDGN